IAAAYCSSIKNHYLEVLNNSKLKFIHEREQILNQLSDDVREVEKEKIWAEELAERIETMERT
ncbi:MAG: hypothetical protein IKN45_08800, partial [Lachnospiraceae bacterium]|nr:hypothetical protein [Lachnospiraceae bacterium]